MDRHEALRELDRLIAAFSIPELARAVSLEATYQVEGGRLSRRAWYEQRLQRFFESPRRAGVYA